MVEWNGWYLAAGSVTAIKICENGDPSWPYRMEVVIQDQTYFCRYKNRKQCELEARQLAARIGLEKSDRWESMQNRLYLIEDAVKRIDRRQLRIWRILKALLSVEEGSVTDE